LNDGYNNNLNNTFNNKSQNNTRWSYSGDVSLLEPEILKDMGVDMLEKEIINCGSTKKLQSEECIVLPANLDNKQRLLTNRIENFEYEQEVSTSSSSEINVERFVL
jgi:hypothetical protein